MKRIRVDLLMFDRLQDNSPGFPQPQGWASTLKDTSLDPPKWRREDPHFYRMPVTEWAEALEELSEHLGASLCRECQSWDEGQQAIPGLVTVFPPGVPTTTAQQMQG